MNSRTEEEYLDELKRLQEEQKKIAEEYAKARKNDINDVLARAERGLLSPERQNKAIDKLDDLDA